MTRTLADEDLEIVCVEAPEPRWTQAIRSFLVHKPSPYDTHLDQALAGDCGALETRFYLGLRDGALVGNVMTVERRGVGIFGHVFTRPDQRRQGICNRIIAAQMADFRARDGRVLLLGTGYGSSAYRLYAANGFRDWPGRTNGLMRYDNPDAPDFLDHWFGDTDGQIVTAGWEHWPAVALLATIETPVRLRSLALNLWGTGLLEGPYCGLMASRARPDRHAAVLQNEAGAALALATVLPDARWPGIRLLDLFAHPNVVSGRLAALVESLPIQNGPVRSWSDPHDTRKREALEVLGFARTATVPGLIRRADGSFGDAWLFGRG